MTTPLWKHIHWSWILFGSKSQTFIETRLCMCLIFFQDPCDIPPQKFLKLFKNVMVYGNVSEIYCSGHVWRTSVPLVLKDFRPFSFRPRGQESETAYSARKDKQGRGLRRRLFILKHRALTLIPLRSPLHHSLLVCTSQAWTTARCWSRWSEATGCSAPRTVPSHYTSWCCSVGRRTQRSGPPLNTCKPSWRTTLQRLSLSTSPGTTSKPPPIPSPMFPAIGYWQDQPSQCCYKTFQARTLWYGCVQLPQL